MSECKRERERKREKEREKERVKGEYIKNADGRETKSSSMS